MLAHPRARLTSSNPSFSLSLTLAHNAISLHGSYGFLVHGLIQFNDGHQHNDCVVPEEVGVELGK